MLNQRRILPIDRDLLSQWIEADSHHRDTTTPDFFYEEGTICNVYSDDKGPVFFMRGLPFIVEGMKSIRLDIQFDNTEIRRNGRMLLKVDKVFCTQAKEAGFKEIFFTSESPQLKAFCKKALDFVEIEPGMLVKHL